MTDADFHRLMSVRKYFEQTVVLPAVGGTGTWQLSGATSGDRFFLDINRKGKLELTKYTIQNRYVITRQPLVRVDIDSPPHINPDGTKKSRNHIHLFRESGSEHGNLPWAYEFDEIDGLEIFLSRLDFMSVFDGFCNYCNIDTANIQRTII